MSPRAMPAGRPERDDIALLPPFPEGWYFVASRRSIQKEEADSKDLDGRENCHLVG